MVTLPSNSCFLPILTGTRSCWFHLLGLSGTCLSLPLKIRCLSLSLLGAAAKFPFIFLPALFLILCLPQHRCPTNFAKKRTFLSYHLIETLQWLHTSRKIKGPRLTTWFNPDFHNCFPCYIFIPYSKHTYPSPHHRDVIEHFHFLLFFFLHWANCYPSLRMSHRLSLTLKDFFNPQLWGVGRRSSLGVSLTVHFSKVAMSLSLPHGTWPTSNVQHNVFG